MLTTQDNGHHVHRRHADQSAAERPADSAGRRGARAAQAARPEPRHAVSDRSRRRRTTRAGKRTCSTISATAASPRSSTSGRAAPICPCRAPSTTFRCSTSRRRAAGTTRPRRCSPATCRVRLPGCCRAARSTAPPCSGSSCCARSRSSARSASRNTPARIAITPRRCRSRSASAACNSLTAQYTRSSLRDTLNFLNPQDGVLEDRVSPNDRPHRFSGAATVCGCRSAADRSGAAAGTVWSTRWPAAGRSAARISTRTARRWSSPPAPTSTRRAISGGLTSSIGKTDGQLDLGARHARLGRLVLLLP